MKGLQIENEQLRFAMIGANGKETIVPNHAGTDQKWVAEDRTNHLMWSLLELRVRLD